ncbi:GYDIA family GHMP kinase [Flavobacterium capsici]|uniref:GYDIA family GHMP kinase n=1 Tax=Flavobacterium capsici TaxID=3075618 RepID=A0AA96EWZ8_9FLAO|nr:MULTISPECIES: GYDIA family GHMP kinase [unclassified Flavobacterium]WNM19974.1 GYDIA family GHMP kinase [Flavobacterium sp. PMR2A8]WNM21363.1 GYDIA family GHMP kinase [Flavobacterium sp. PMTSA4]
MKTFYSNGKLLITSEYVVLDGAIALALPTKFGQSLHIKDGENEIFQWKSYDSDASIWFEANIPFSSIVRKERLEEENNIKNKLIEILHEAYKINSNFITNSKGYIIETELTFPKNWGLGTSSTLINNIAQWLEIDAFELLKNSFGGSGYDIACAQNDSGILYQLIDEKPIVNTIPFSPSFAENIYFVYLNKKQNSRDAIHNYINKRGNIYEFLPEFNTITNKIINADSVDSFSQLLEKHEILLSTILEQSTAKDLFFEDFDGVIKSLGAWGGDFVMAISKENPNPYFKSKGFETVLTYHEMIL